MTLACGRTEAVFGFLVLSVWTLHVVSIFVLVSSNSPKTCKSGGLETGHVGKGDFNMLD